MRLSCLFLLAFLASLPITALAEPVRIAASWPAMVDAEGMRQRIDTPRLRVVDLRDAERYSEGHAEGAVSVPFPAWEDAARNGTLSALIGQAGIHPSRPLLLVHDDTALDSFVDAAWLGWELRRRGVLSVTILEGGMAAWEGAGLRTTARVHRHRTYDLPFEVDGLTEASQNEVAGIQLGVADGQLLEVTGPDGRGYGIEGVPSLAMADLVGNGTFEPLDLLERLKSVPVAWEAERVVAFSDDSKLAAAFWFLASEVLGIRDIGVLPAASGDTNIAGLD